MKLTLQFGAMAPKLAEQLDGIARLPKSLLSAFQQDADAVTRLAVRGLLPDGETAKARKRLLKRVAAQVEFARGVDEAIAPARAPGEREGEEGGKG